MTLLGKIDNLENEDKQDNENYTLPAVTREEKEGLTLKKSLVISAILHPLVLGIIYTALFILALLGIKNLLWDRPTPKVNDIEFVLVDKEAMPKNKNTRFRADRNSRTGGINDPKRKISMPSPAPSKKTKSASGSNSTQKLIKKVQKQQAQQAKKTIAKQQAAGKTTTMKQPEARPQPPSVRPSVKPPQTPTRVAPSQTTPFAIPVPKSTLAQGNSYSTGPIGGSGTAANGGARYAPTPSLSPTVGTGSGSGGSKVARGTGSGYGYGTGTGGGTGNYGNPGGGGGAPGIDAIREPDFGPYMKELQRRIKINWDPPKGNESKRVVLLFKIAKDGRLLSNRVFKSSGLPSADKAALNAVELTAPFKPLPAAFGGQSIDIQFTFDYNVFGASRY